MVAADGCHRGTSRFRDSLMWAKGIDSFQKACIP